MKFLKGISFALIAILMVSFAHAGVNLKNGNFYISYTDIVVPGGGKKLEITRTYNSKSTEVGWFGFGWGSEFETRLELSADGSVIIHEHGSGAKTRFTPKTPVDAVAASTKIVNEMKKKTALTETAAADLVKKTFNKRRTSSHVRNELRCSGNSGSGFYSLFERSWSSGTCGFERRL